ncbi:MAG: hypothetical protein HZB62_05375 [Nitrospirae bacterium]|nr:hypothetical protein [Nitrospirota bacterium]
MNITGEIKFFLGDGDYAHLKFSESRTSFSIDIVSVPAAYRSKGIGSLLIGRVLLMADTMDKDIYLSARPIGAYTVERLSRLVSYYQRFGFSVIDEGLTMVSMKRIAKTAGAQHAVI